MSKYVVVNPAGAASGSVWHIIEHCSQSTTFSDTRPVTDEEIRLLGFSQCRACQRHERLASIDANVHLAEVFASLGLDKLMKHEVYTIANNVRDRLAKRGVQLIYKENE